jgi:hypothetical protein
MEQITLTEDSCMARNIDFKAEKQKLIDAGYVILSEYTHPAVGKVITLLPPRLNAMSLNL